MNFSELTAELFARGTDYLDEDADSRARAERWLNQAYREILNLQAWPFLEAVATGSTGAGSVTIADLRRIRFVQDLTTKDYLSRTTLDDLADEGLDVTQTGTAEFYYVEGGTVVNTWPVGGTIQVYYIKRVGALSGTQTPVFLDEYHDLIIDRAMMKAYKDSDNFEARAALKEEYDAGVAAMAEDYQIVSREVTYMQVDPYDG